LKQIFERISRIAKANYNANKKDDVASAEEYLKSTEQEDDLSKLIENATKSINAKQSKEYTVLGIKYTDNMDTIKKAYRSALLKNHPDKFANGTKEQQEYSRQKTAEIIAAYNKIMKERMQQ